MELILGIALWALLIASAVAIIKKIIKAMRALFKKGNNAHSTTSSTNSKYQHVQSNPHDPTLALDEALLWELQQNGKIRAIKLLREKTGYSLSDAKIYVENLELCVPAYNTYKSNLGVSKATAIIPRAEDVSSVDGMEGHAFEHYCAQLLEKNCFTDVSITPPSGDQGVDILATKDGIKYAIQCKNYATPLGNTPIQEVNAGKVFYSCHVGVVMTNSTFTAKAKELALATGVLLWDRRKLQELISASSPMPKTTVPKLETSANYSSAPTTQLSSKQIVQGSATHRSAVSEPSPHTAGLFSPQEPSDSISNFFVADNKSPILKEDIDIEGVRLNIHISSANALNLTLSNFGIDKDDGPDEFTLLFDVEAKNTRGIPEDITIVCNAFAGNQKLATEHGYLYKKSFDWKDSLEVYFDKKNLVKRTTRIEIFCKRR